MSDFFTCQINSEDKSFVFMLYQKREFLRPNRLLADRTVQHWYRTTLMTRDIRFLLTNNCQRQGLNLRKT